MSDTPDKATFAAMYADKAPWDISGPQPAFVAAADRITGDVLDAGCGTGEHSLFLANRGHRVVGIDFLEEPILRAQAKATDRSLEATFIVMDALALAAWDQRFDCAIDSGLFHGLSDEDRRTYVAGLAHVLKPGGRLFLMCFSETEPEGRGPRRVTQKELREAFSTGWAVESIIPARFTVIPEYRDVFSSGGPHAWFATIQRK